MWCLLTAISRIFLCVPITGGATPRVLGRQLPLPPPPPLGAFGQQLVAKGVALLKPKLDSNTHPQPSAYSYPYT